MATDRVRDGDCVVAFALSATTALLYLDRREVSMGCSLLLRTIRRLAWLAAIAGLSMVGAGNARACACAQISPAQGFARAEYVFTGKVVEIEGNTWTVAVDRVWKGGERLAGRVHLLDVYTGIDCAFYFETGRSYLFFAIVAKSSRYVYYQPEVCNWTSALGSRRVAGPDGAVLLEDFIVKNFGPGEAPKADDPWQRPPARPTGAPS